MAEEVRGEQQPEVATVQESVVTPTVPKEAKGLSIAGMVIGICSVVLGFYLGFILGVLAIIFSAIGLKRKKNGFAIAGLVTGIVGTIIGIIVGIAIIIVAYAGIQQAATDASVRSSASTVEERAELAYSTYGVYPSYEEMQNDLINNDLGVVISPQGEGGGGDVVYIPCYGEGAIIWYWSESDSEYKQIDVGSTTTCEWND